MLQVSFGWVVQYNASSDAVSQDGQLAGWGLAGGNAQSVTTILEDLKISLKCAEDATCTVFDIFGRRVSAGWRWCWEAVRLLR